MNHSTLLALLVCLCTSGLHPQAYPVLQKGSRVRVTFFGEDGRPFRDVVGNLWRLQNDTVTVGADSVSTEVISLEANSKLEVSRGSHGHAGVGAVIGAVVGLVSSVVVYKSCDDCEGGLPASWALLSLFGGAAAGGILGSFFSTERWEGAQTAGIRIGLGSTEPRLTISFSGQIR